MEIRVTREELTRGVNTVNKAVPNRTTMQILECILFKAIDGKISLIANDTEMAIETTIEGEINETGIKAIDAKMLSALVGKLPDDDVHIVTDNVVAHIKCGKLKVNIPVKNGEDFPDIPQVSDGDKVVISQLSLRDVIKQTIFATEDNTANKMMSGELFDVSGNNLRVIALDGHRIAIRSIILKGDFGTQKVIIPGKALNELSKLLTGGVNDEVRINLTANHALFEFGNTTVVTRLIEGNFFDTDKITNMDFPIRASVNKREFAESIDRSMLLISTTDKKPVIVDISDDTLEWSLKTASGSMSETINAEKSGEDIKIGFNPKFLLDALKVIDDENVTLHLVNSKSPCAIKDDANSYLYLVLPVNFAQ